MDEFVELKLPWCPLNHLHLFDMDFIDYVDIKGKERVVFNHKTNKWIEPEIVDYKLFVIGCENRKKYHKDKTRKWFK